MSDLEEKIKEQYGKRKHLNSLYNSYYSMRTMHERGEKIREILSNHQCRDKSVLELGAGHGGNIPMLLMCGFLKENIHLNELLPERIKVIKDNFAEYSLYEGDFLELEFKQKYDYVFQSTVFSSVLDNQTRKTLADKMWDLLKPGGYIVWYDFVYNNPNNNQVRKVTAKEVKSLFPGALRTEFHKITLAPPIGRRVGKLYSLFNLPFLRTHILALLQKPEA
ncbi:MAG: class I SAM-dependent methyltransferase [Bacteroidia bacterium]|jgi:SAM-dependent methyltransferase|nr:class I SAM-dependent methyltransferase [Bacteroidia bacterium]